MDIVRDPVFFSTVAHMALFAAKVRYDFHESSLLGNWNLLGHVFRMVSNWNRWRNIHQKWKIPGRAWSFLVVWKTRFLGGALKCLKKSPKLGVSWSNLMCAYFSDGLVKNHQPGFCKSMPDGPKNSLARLPTHLHAKPRKTKGNSSCNFSLQQRRQAPKVS